MTKRRWLIIFAVLLVAVAGVGVYLLIPPKPGVTLQNFQRMHKGMTLEQVDKILGSKGTQGAPPYKHRTYRWNGIGNEWCEIEFVGSESPPVNYVYCGSYYKGDVQSPIVTLEPAPEELPEKIRRWTGW